MADALDITIRPELVDLAVLVREVATANQPLADNKKQVITVSAPTDCPVSCDGDRMREAIDNLVSNAIKYSPAGGHIELLVDQAPGETHVRVRDEGAGLSPEDMARLFGRFQRLSAKPTAGESSTGLGLSIAKRIVELHGGSISAQSEGAGLGTTFTMRLPVG
jgi:signal transduction histidine kinase